MRSSLRRASQQALYQDPGSLTRRGRDILLAPCLPPAPARSPPGNPGRTPPRSRRACQAVSRPLRLRARPHTAATPTPARTRLAGSGAREGLGRGGLVGLGLRRASVDSPMRRSCALTLSVNDAKPSTATNDTRAKNDMRIIGAPGRQPRYGPQTLFPCRRLTLQSALGPSQEFFPGPFAFAGCWGPPWPGDSTSPRRRNVLPWRTAGERPPVSKPFPPIDR
jgi:hypothetical protein